MIGALACLAAVLFGGLIVIWRAAVLVSRQLQGIPPRIRGLEEAWREVPAESSQKKLRDLEDLVDRLPQRWEEIKRESNRLESRARHSVNRVRRELAKLDLEDDSIEGLAGELSLIDGGAGESDGVPDMPEGVEGGAAANPEASVGIEPWRALANKRKYS